MIQPLKTLWQQSGGNAQNVALMLDAKDAQIEDLLGEQKKARLVLSENQQKIQLMTL